MNPGATKRAPQDLFVNDDNQSDPTNPTNNVVAVEVFDRLCRTCLVEDGKASIFEEVYDETPVSDLLKLYVAIEINREDRLPQNICRPCLSDLHHLHSFVQKCRRSDVLLRYVNTKTVEPHLETCNELKTIDVKPVCDEYGYETTPQVEACDNGRSTVRKRTRNTRKAGQKRHPFECKDCGETYTEYVHLKTHRREAKHPEARNHACPVCSKTFTSSKLRQHMRAHTKEKPYQCKICFQGFSMSGNLKRHTMTHTGERPHVCEICGKGFIQATTLQNHRNTHAKYERLGADANGPHFICNYCGRGFKRLARYNAHLKKHLDDSRKAPVAIRDDRPRGEHACTVCKRAYKTKHLLKAHQLTHGEKTFLCSDCGKGFVTKAALQSHLKVHTGEKPHTCNVCKKSFAHVGSFEAHMLIHTGRKPYNCNVCTKAFTQLSHLKYHLRTHSGERPYVCSFCGKSFALKGNLTVHVRTHTGETPYVCTFCGKGFYDSSSMKKHKRAHGGGGGGDVDPGNSGGGTTASDMNAAISVNTVDVINSMNGVDLNALIA